MPKTGTTAPPAAAKKNTAKPSSAAKNSATPAAAAPTGSALEIKDTRTSKTYNVPVAEGAIRATELKKIKTDDPDDKGLMSYDPAFLNTASCRSAITYIDGDKGILRYRGYPIEQLAENATFLEVAWLLRHGELPTQQEYDQFVHEITFHTYVHENMRKFLEGFRYDAHPMAMLNSSVAGLAAFYPSARNIFDETERNISIIRLLAKTPTIAAFSYRHVKGLPFVYPDNRLSYVENFLSMVARMSESKYEANPVFARALEILFILHADHEQNCSTNAVRAVGSSHVDPFSAVSAGVAALFGPLHGGANEQVMRMVEEIKSPARAEAESVSADDDGPIEQEFFRLPDCAAEILLAFEKQLSQLVDVKHLLDLLTPELDSKTVTHQQYRHAFAEDPTRFYPTKPSVIDNDADTLRRKLGRLKRRFLS